LTSPHEQSVFRIFQTMFQGAGMDNAELRQLISATGKRKISFV